MNALELLGELVEADLLDFEVGGGGKGLGGHGHPAFEMDKCICFYRMPEC